MLRTAALPERHFDDPVAAYDELAPYYANFSAQRAAYLWSIEDLIVRRLPRGAKSLLDLGSGDGLRARRLAAQARIERVVLVEPSPRMAPSLAAADAKIWRIRAEDLALQAAKERFDVITCLWNVLGHILTGEKRRLALAAIAHRLSPGGRLFFDVTYRYNALSYGAGTTFYRYLHDRLRPYRKVGDVVARWPVPDRQITTYGHVFTHAEILALTRATGLELEERLIVDYRNGRVHRFSFLGNLLYIFGRSAASDSDRPRRLPASVL